MEKKNTKRKIPAGPNWAESRPVSRGRAALLHPGRWRPPSSRLPRSDAPAASALFPRCRCRRGPPVGRRRPRGARRPVQRGAAPANASSAPPYKWEPEPPAPLFPAVSPFFPETLARRGTRSRAPPPSRRRLRVRWPEPRTPPLSSFAAEPPRTSAVISRGERPLPRSFSLGIAPPPRSIVPDRAPPRNAVARDPAGRRRPRERVPCRLL